MDVCIHGSAYRREETAVSVHTVCTCVGEMDVCICMTVCTCMPVCTSVGEMNICMYDCVYRCGETAVWMYGCVYDVYMYV